MQETVTLTEKIRQEVEQMQFKKGSFEENLQKNSRALSGVESNLQAKIELIRVEKNEVENKIKEVKAEIDSIQVANSSKLKAEIVQLREEKSERQEDFNEAIQKKQELINQMKKKRLEKLGNSKNLDLDFEKYKEQMRENFEIKKKLKGNLLR